MANRGQHWVPEHAYDETAANLLDLERKKLIGNFTPNIFATEQGQTAAWPASYLDMAKIPFVEKVQYVKTLNDTGDAFGGEKVIPQVMVPVTDRDTEEMDKKLKIIELEKFDTWFAHFFDMASPAEREMMRSVYPAYFENRIKTNLAAHNFQHKLAEISINGIKDFTDLYTLYQLHRYGPEDVAKSIGPGSENVGIQGIYTEGPFASFKLNTLLADELKKVPHKMEIPAARSFETEEGNLGTMGMLLHTLPGPTVTGKSGK
jgi:hypothetical protein